MGLPEPPGGWTSTCWSAEVRNANIRLQWCREKDTGHLRIGNGKCDRMNYAKPYFAKMEDVEFCENPTKP
ncbi:hypothetical protein TNCV_1694161 [Trichonephila clavipes]|nr:hypothetical protein TNCV_1694161 [Trichonephila clavipes]